MTLDVKTGAKSRPSKAISSMEEGGSYARPKVSSNDGFHAMSRRWVVETPKFRGATMKIKNLTAAI